MAGTIAEDSAKIESEFDKSVAHVAEEHEKRSKAFAGQEKDHAITFNILDSNENKNNNATMSYLQKFNTGKAPAMREIFESHADNIGVTLSTEDLPIRIKKKKEKKPHTSSTPAASVIVVETAAPNPKGHKKKKGQGATPIATTAAVEALSQNIAKVIHASIGNKV